MRSFVILPAAGRSRRMGQPKLWLPWQGRPLLEHVLHVWNEAGLTRVVVVVHPDDEQLAALARGCGVDVVQPDEPPQEMKISVRCGLQHLSRTENPDGADVWLLAPADMPELTSTAIRQVLAAHREDDPAIVVPTCGGRRGHPVLFPWPLAGEVDHLAANEGVNALLKRHPVRTIECDDPAILSDLDTPEEYRQARRRAP